MKKLKLNKVLSQNEMKKISGGDSRYKCGCGCGETSTGQTNAGSSCDSVYNSK